MSDINTFQTVSRPETVAKPTNDSALHSCVETSLRNYFANLDGQPVVDLYDMVLAEIEEPLLKIVMENTKGNQSKAAKWLGISRGTLRKKLKIYDIID